MDIPDRFSPLPTVLAFDEFDRGQCGWLDLRPNFVRPGFGAHSEEDEARFGRVELEAQISADGIRWTGEGTRVRLDGPGLAACRVANFGGWLRLSGVIRGGEQRPCSASGSHSRADPGGFPQRPQAGIPAARARGPPPAGPERRTPR